MQNISPTYFFGHFKKPTVKVNLIGSKSKPIKARGEKNAANMVLAYEISVNDEFQMGGAEPRENTVQGQVKKTVEKAFWDILRDQMKNGDDEMVFGIIREIREQILNFLAPNSATRERIKAQLDMELIEQQWIAGTLELKVKIRDILDEFFDMRPGIFLILV